MAVALYQIDVARRQGEKAACMAEEIRESLSAELPWIPCKYFYDDRGSRLYEEITRLPEYYQTRTEERLLETIADELIARTQPSEVIELGSGAGRKIHLLLDAIARAGLGSRCTMLDINGRFVTESVQRLASDYPWLKFRGLVGDFLLDLDALGPGVGRLVVFFAGTIGNLHPDDVPPFLARVGRRLAPGDSFLVGLDLVKDVARLEAAYNDAAGVTAAFNLNILRHLNAELGANFDLSAFEHVAFYDRANAWIEMRLRARRPTRVRIPVAGLVRGFEAGDEIRTEISCKYTRASFAARLPGTGFDIDAWFTDPDDLFALALLGRTAEGPNIHA